MKESERENDSSRNTLVFCLIIPTQGTEQNLLVLRNNRVQINMGGGPLADQHKIFISYRNKCPSVLSLQSVIKMPGFRSLAKGEALQFLAKDSDKGSEATLVTGCEDVELQGSTFRPTKGLRKSRRCYNCGKFQHIASKCDVEPQPKRCHICQSEDHLVVDCPQKPPGKVQPPQSQESGET